MALLPFAFSYFPESTSLPHDSPIFFSMRYGCFFVDPRDGLSMRSELLNAGPSTRRWLQIGPDTSISFDLVGDRRECLKAFSLLL